MDFEAGREEGCLLVTGLCDDGDGRGAATFLEGLVDVDIEALRGAVDIFLAYS